ncbi:MAG: hypothetical protein Q7S51_07795, partial [Gallionellaceae bacterium]|nr:hypothetical protein [Gallionellaceae bacterium]
MTVFDGIKTTTTNTTITVTDPETIFAATNTICFSTAGNFTGCPAGATQVTTSNFVTALSGYQGATRRLLFKRGETFTAATAASITSTGPGIIGAFGVGAAPIVQMTGSSAILNLSSNATPTISDWRVMDLELDGLSQQASIGVQGFGGMSKVTMLRLNIHDVGEGFTFSLSTLDFFNSDGNPGHAGHALWDQIAIVDSSVQRVIQNPGGNGVFLSAQRFSLLGNFIDDSTLAEHIVRLPMIVQGVISNNTLSNQAPLKTILKLHGPTWCAAGSAVVNGLCSTKSPGYTVGVLPSGIGGDAGGYTEKVVISDNKLLSSDGTDWTVNTGPQNAQSDERLRDIIVERNWFIPGNTTSAALVINAARETVRNNICIIVNDGACLRVEMRGYGPTSVEPPPTDVAVYNNTFYTASAVSFTGVRVGVGAISTVIKNNLGYAPSGTGTPTVINDFGTSTVGAAGSMGNSSDAQVKNTSPS